MEIVGSPGTTSVMLSWEELPGVTRYEISFKRSLSSGFTERHTQCGGFEHEGTQVGVGNLTEYTLYGLQEDSVYDITVTAVYPTLSVPHVVTVTTQLAGN